MSREYDIVVFGATGFTGGMTAEYLARHAPADVRWAVAGRSAEKLRAVKQRLVAIDERCHRVGSVVASLDDVDSLERMAASTRVLLTTVGPFIDFGEPVVRACVEQGCDYIDSTGEPYFVQLVLGRYGAKAKSEQLRIVQCCGFDSIPPDLGALFTVEQLPRDKAITLRSYMSLAGSFSGGTERSAIKSLVRPDNLPDLPPPAPAAGRKVELLPSRVHRRPEIPGWFTPLPTVDSAIVQRSAAALERYGPDFRYAHYAVHRSLPVMLAAAVVFGSLALFARIAPLRALLLAAVKKPGQGPSEKQMRAAWFKLRFVAECDGRIVQTEVAGGDPGYGETSKMLAESALCLACDREALPARFGVLTPAEAMGDLLLARLQRAGLSFRVLDG